MLAAVLLLLLAGCAQPVPLVCPPVPKYSKELQAEAAEELKEAGYPPTVLRFMQDYGELRAWLRGACG